MVADGPEHSAAPRRRRSTPLQAARPSQPTRWSRVRGQVGTAAALVAAAIVGGFVLSAAQTPTEPVIETAGDEALAALAPVRTQTSAPRVLPAADGPGAVADDAAVGSTAELDVVTSGRAIVSGDDVPTTGGYTDLIRRYFGPLTVEAIVIVQCESGFDPSAVGTNTNGTQDHGLFQINDIHLRTFEAVTGRSWDERYDPEVNTAFAAWLHDHAGGWGPWRCNRNLATYDEPAGD